MREALAEVRGLIARLTDAIASGDNQTAQKVELVKTLVQRNGSDVEELARRVTNVALESEKRDAALSERLTKVETTIARLFAYMAGAAAGGALAGGGVVAGLAKFVGG